MSTTSDPVVIVGAGPVGLWLACELRLAGVPVHVLERTPERGPYNRGLGVHARTLEVLAMRSLVEEPIANGRRMPGWHFGMLTSLIDFSHLDTDYPYVLAYPQRLLENLLERRAIELGAVVVRGCTVTGLSQDASAVLVNVEGADGPGSLQAQYVIGCDGTRSTVRSTAGFAFSGTETTLLGYLADVTLDNPPEVGSVTFAGTGGTLIVAHLPDGRYRLAGFDPQNQDHDVPLSIEILKQSVSRAAGHDFGLRDPIWTSRFGNATKQAETYRIGRVLLAGDAAHMHMPAGGLGLNIGIQDAMNLGWKLAAVAQGRASDTFLDTYESERHPVGAELLKNTQAQTALIAAFTPEGVALRALLAELITSHPQVADDLALRISGLGLAYDNGSAGHPWIGKRFPNLAIDDTSLFALLADGRPVLLNFDAQPSDSLAAQAQAIGIRTRRASPGPGQEGLSAVLIRPDGYVWWATDDASTATLDELGVHFRD